MAHICYILVAVLSFVVLSEAWYPEDEATLRTLARKWRKEYKKEYKTREEEEERFWVFSENVKYINELNKMHLGKTEFGLNQFADMTPKEFQSKILMPKRTPPLFEKSRYISGPVSGNLPDTFDWTTKGAVTPVKDQGDVGTCWAFSTIGNIEGQWQLIGQPLTNLSVEQVVECDGTCDHGSQAKNADCGVFGGWPYLAYQYVMKAGGLETWEEYWYCCGLGGKPGTCEVCPAAGYNWTLCGDPVPFCNTSQSCYSKINQKKFVNGLKVVDWKAIDTNESVIAEQLMNIGPLSVALDATLLQFYHKGVFDPIFCSKTNLDHAVLMVGFGISRYIIRGRLLRP